MHGAMMRRPMRAQPVGGLVLLQLRSLEADIGASTLDAKPLAEREVDDASNENHAHNDPENPSYASIVHFLLLLTQTCGPSEQAKGSLSQ